MHNLSKSIKVGKVAQEACTNIVLSHGFYEVCLVEAVGNSYL